MAAAFKAMQVIMCMQASVPGAYRNSATFNTDSDPIGIDNRCTACISHRIDDFEGVIQDSNRVIKGFGGATTGKVKIGTIVWNWCDDKGEKHRFKIPNSYYVPSGNVRLLSPQHWAKTQTTKTTKGGTGETTNRESTTLFWHEGKNKLTVPLGKNDKRCHIPPGTWV